MCRSRSGAVLALLLVCAVVVATGKRNKGGVGQAEVECSDLATGAECVNRDCSAVSISSKTSAEQHDRRWCGVVDVNFPV
ncbi:hypothetical protein E2562_023024 [Oryza meyeriana var. granulata]|uniref:Secreted protein n=1 Tax=Oryza meyeriana var. granulata TaxID=110450 RepID=A0A6G1EYI3_9ORYZ|nr:hypothetical protein E2562_023024 [Oryza meyeriana var. granulata]